MSKVDLCRPCLEAFKRAGNKLSLVQGGSDRKVTCSCCGRRKYGATYELSLRGVKMENIVR